MRPELQQELVDRVLAHVGKRTTDCGDTCGTAPTANYLSPEILERERALFRRTPLLAAHGSMFPSPGDFITRTIAGAPVLLARGEDRRARAFLNVCRHRGTQVEQAASGCGKSRFTCPYHGWAYGLDGRLAGVPHQSGFPHVELGTTGLVELGVEELGGLIFLRLDGGPARPEQFAPILEDFQTWQVATHHVYTTRTFERALNWKLTIDIFLEAYHLRNTHERTIAEIFFDNLGLVDPIGPHTRNVFAKKTIRSLNAKPRDEWRIRDHANVLYHLFPNTLILFEPDHAAVMQVQPLGLDRARVDAIILIPAPATSIRARAYWDANVRILYDAIEEDFAMGESIQRGLGSGANDALTFGRFEHALTNFHQALDRALSPGHTE